MQSAWVIAAAILFLGAGLGIGFLLMRQGRAAAVLAARQALEIEVASLRQQIRGQGDLLAEARRQAGEAQARVAGAQAEQRAADGRAAELGAQVAKAEADLDASRGQAAALAEEAAELRAAVERLHSSEKELMEDRTRLQEKLEAGQKAAAERAAESERTREQVRAEVEKLAGRVLDVKGKELLDRSQADLHKLLDPLRDRLKDFEAKVEKTYDQDNKDRASLLQKLADLQETQRKLHEDAEGLARALTGESKVQGDWGELVLETVLEAAGLAPGREFELQVTHRDEEGGHKRPDAIVYLPHDRAVVVDAKCSLTAFVEAAKAATPEEREEALDRHLASVRAHVKSLAGKGYQDVLQRRTLDVVLMFVPSEAAFQAALSRDWRLCDEAFRQRVVLCSPTTLLAALKIIAHLWQLERQDENAQRIAQEAGKLLEKLDAFVEDMDDVGRRLEQAQDSFAAARGKLQTGKGNAMKKAADILRLGAQARPDKVQRLLRAAGLDEAEEDAEAVPGLPAAASGPDPGAAA